MVYYDNPNVCSKCTGKCCRYFMLQLDTPRTRSDFENIRWYISHKGASIAVEDRKWFLHMESVCHHLSGDGRCAIYDTRPEICREHNPGDCEYDSIYQPDIFFKSLQQLDEYIQKRFSRRRKVTLKVASR